MLSDIISYIENTDKDVLRKELGKCGVKFKEQKGDDSKMKFIVARTSVWGEEKPCEEAKMEKYTEEYKGVATGRIRWVVEINTLEELMDFCNKYGDIIICHKDKYGVNRHSIEIYDDYRE